MKKRIKILYIIDSLFVWGGTEKHLFKLVSGMDKTRYECYVCAFVVNDEVLREFAAAGIKILRLPLDKVYGLAAMKQAARLTQFIQQNQIDVVQTFHFAAEFFGALVGRWARVPVIIASKRDTGFLNNKLHCLALRLIAPLVDKTICVSHAVKKILAEQRLLSAAKTRVIYNGVDLAEFSAHDGNVAEKKMQLGLRPDDEVVTVVANPRPIKDMETFMQSARLVLDVKPDVKFLIAGGACLQESGQHDYQEKLESFAARLNLKGRLFFLGKRTDVDDLLSLTDVCVLTSLSEGFSNTVLEYMAKQKPVVCTNVGGNGEAVTDGETGFLVPTKSPDRVAVAILTLLSDKSLAARMGKAGRARVEQDFVFEKMIEDHDLLYRQLLENAGVVTEKAGQRPQHAYNALNISSLGIWGLEYMEVLPELLALSAFIKTTMRNLF